MGAEIVRNTMDLAYALALGGVFALLAVAYSIRLAIKGRARFARVDKQGGSPLLSKGLMEMVYWGMQPIAKAMIVIGITPNIISWTSLAFGVLTAACLAVGHFGFGAVFATISALLDAMDGMVARLTEKSSDAGEVLDAAVDRYAEFLFFSGLIIYYRELPMLVGLTLMAMIGSFMVSYSTAKAEALHMDVPKGSMRRPERTLYLIVGAFLSPITIPLWETTREFGIAIGHPMVMALCLIAVLSNVSAVERLWSLSRSIRARERDQAEARIAAEARAAQSVLEEVSEDFRRPVKAHRET